MAFRYINNLLLFISCTGCGTLVNSQRGPALEHPSVVYEHLYIQAVQYVQDNVSRERLSRGGDTVRFYIDPSLVCIRGVPFEDVDSLVEIAYPDRSDYFKLRDSIAKEQFRQQKLCTTIVDSGVTRFSTTNDRQHLLQFSQVDSVLGYYKVIAAAYSTYSNGFREPSYGEYVFLFGSNGRLRKVYYQEIGHP
jgi:hypothetical protein